MSIVETRNNAIKESDGVWWYNHPRYTVEITVKNGEIESICGDNIPPKIEKYLGWKFKSFVGKESFGRKQIKIRKVGDI
jgi:hypothetical protein